MIVMVAVSETPIVAARGPTSVASTTAIAGAKNDACYHYHRDHDHDSQERAH